MSIKKTDRTARANYRRKVKRLTIEFYPTEYEIFEYINKQPKKQTYIKDLIRKDILTIKTAQRIDLTMEEQIELCAFATMEKDRAEAFAEYYKRQIYEKRQKHSEGDH